MGDCHDCLFEDVTIHASPSATFTAGSSPGLVVRRVVVEPQPGRYHATSADGVFVLDSRRGPRVEDSRFVAIGDDCFIVKTFAGHCLSSQQDRRLPMQRFQLAGLNVPAPGDVIRVWNPTNVTSGLPAVRGVVASAHGTWANLTVVFKEPLVGISPSDAAGLLWANDNLTGPGFVFRNNTVMSRRFGALVMGKNGAIEGNHFVDNADTAVLLINDDDYDDPREARMGWMPRNISITGNSFTRSCRCAPDPWHSGSSSSLASAVGTAVVGPHAGAPAPFQRVPFRGAQNITIEDNSISAWFYGASGINLGEAHGVTVRRNKIANPLAQLQHLGITPTPAIQTFDSTKATIEDNHLDGGSWTTIRDAIVVDPKTTSDIAVANNTFIGASTLATEKGKERGRRCAFVKASSTNEQIYDLNNYDGQIRGHYVCLPDPAQPPRGLLLFLPGTAPSVYTGLPEVAASSGYHAVSVAWDDRPCAACICAKRCDDFNRTRKLLTCTRNVIAMRFFGTPLAPPNDVGYQVDALNAVLGRLMALIGYLNASSTKSSVASGSWGQFVGVHHGNGSRAALRWADVTIGGHSRGSDYPLLLSKMFGFRRALLFGGPGQAFVGVCSGNRPPSETNCNPARGFGEDPWIREPSKVPPDRFYGLVAGYPGDACNQGRPAWLILGLPGAATFDNATLALAPPQLARQFGGARQLFDVEVCLHASSPHMCMISNIDAPLDGNDSNRSKLESIWRYMLTNDAAVTSAAEVRVNDTNCTMA